MTDATGAVVAGYDYYPFGRVMRKSVNSGTDSQFTFGGKEFDTENSFDFYYFDARFYEESTGRFQSPDPVRNGWNPYSFVNNNPLRFVDPSGMDSVPIHRDHNMALKGEPNYYDWLFGRWTASNAKWLQYLLLDNGFDKYISYWRNTQWAEALEIGGDIAYFWKTVGLKKSTVSGTSDGQKVTASLRRLTSDEAAQIAHSAAMIVYARLMGRLDMVGGARMVQTGIEKEYKNYTVNAMVKLVIDGKTIDIWAVNTKYSGMSIGLASGGVTVGINFYWTNNPMVSETMWQTNVSIALFHEGIHVWENYHKGGIGNLVGGDDGVTILAAELYVYLKSILP